MLTFVGFSPAWQQVYRVANLESGSLLRADAAFSYASGKATNAAIVATRFTSSPVQLATLVGGPIGNVYAADLDRHPLHTLLIDAAPTRVCTTIIPGDGHSTELIENASPVSDDVAPRLLDSLATDTPTAIACSGSLPQGIPDDIYAKVLKCTDGPTIVDAAGQPLLESLAAQPTLVKPNRDELNATLGTSIATEAPADDPALVNAMQKLIERGAQAVFVTNGANPATLLASDPSTGKAELSVFEVPPVPKLVNPIGAGDSFTGSALAALAQSKPLENAIQAGLQAAALKCQHLRPEEIPPQATA